MHQSTPFLIALGHLLVHSISIYLKCLQQILKFSFSNFFFKFSSDVANVFSLLSKNSPLVFIKTCVKPKSIACVVILDKKILFTLLFTRVNCYFEINVKYVYLANLLIEEWFYENPQYFCTCFDHVIYKAKLEIFLCFAGVCQTIPFSIDYGANENDPHEYIPDTADKTLF